MKSKSCYNSDSLVNYITGAYRKCKIPNPFVCFVKRVASLEPVADALSQLTPKPVRFVHGGMSSGEREALAASFRAGEISGVVATTVWSTGVDLPNLAAVIRAAGGSAPIGLKQESGRGTRLFGAKEEFTIYDVSVDEDDKHQRARLKHYQAGGFNVSGSIGNESISSMRAPRDGDDESLEALFNADPIQARDQRAEERDYNKLVASETERIIAERAEKERIFYNNLFTILSIAFIIFLLIGMG